MNKVANVIIVIALIAVVGLVFAMKQKNKVITPRPVTSENSNTNVITDVNQDVTAQPQVINEAPQPAIATDSNPTQIKAPLPHLIDLGAGKCIPCKMMKPILDDLKQNYKEQLKVTFIDVWENPDEAKKYNINMIPTQIFYDASGKELFRHEGFFSKEEILGKWKLFGVSITK